ncbi:MAG: T9SS type A sorting domain-containing protein [Salibacteraceae bacterium]
MKLKHTLFILFFIPFLTPKLSYTQCVPDSTISGLYSPDENEGLPSGSVWVPYEAVISIHVPEDTTYMTFTAQVDSLKLNDVTGLPGTFEYDCNTPNCSFEGGSYGCIRVFGVTKDNADAKTWDITADFSFYLSQPNIQLPYEITDYSITLDSVAVGISEADYSKLQFIVTPNPISERSNLLFDLPSTDLYVMDVYSLLGNNVMHMESLGKRGENQISLARFYNKPGVYFVSLKQGEYKRSMRFIVR